MFLKLYYTIDCLNNGYLKDILFIFIETVKIFKNIFLKKYPGTRSLTKELNKLHLINNNNNNSYDVMFVL